MPVRVIVTVTTPSAEAADAAVAERIALCQRTESEEEGCLQYEVFRSAVHPERYVLCELWENREIYDKHWKLQQEREKNAPPKSPPPPSAPEAPQRRGTVEFYEQHLFRNVEGVWMPAEAEFRSETVRWR